MDTLEYFIKSSEKELNFLLTDFGFESEVKNTAYEYSIIFKKEKIELRFLTELGNISVPHMEFKISKTIFNLKRLSNQDNLEKIIEKNYNRTHPIMEKEVKEYLRENKHNYSESEKDFNKNGMNDIDEFLKEVAEILKNNEQILKGYMFPFIKARFNWK